MPKEGDAVEFEAWCKTVRHPVVLYADFETIPKKNEERRGENTTIIQAHKPASFVLLVSINKKNICKLCEQAVLDKPK